VWPFIQRCQLHKKRKKGSLLMFIAHLCSHLTMGTKKLPVFCRKCISYTSILLGVVMFVATTVHCCGVLPCILKIKNRSLRIILWKHLQYFWGATACKTHVGMMALEVHFISTWEFTLNWGIKNCCSSVCKLSGCGMERTLHLQHCCSELVFIVSQFLLSDFSALDMWHVVVTELRTTPDP
jgi:hypothetical protein